MNASLAIQKREEALKLPLGHVDIKKTREVVAKIYHQCHELEKYWHKRLAKFWDTEFTPRECLVFCNNLCRSMGAKTIRKVVFRSPEVQNGAGAHYTFYKREIHFKWAAYRLGTVIHELAHHIAHQVGSGGQKKDHGEDFCISENWLFQLAYEKLAGKKPKPYWLEESQKIIEEK